MEMEKPNIDKIKKEISEIFNSEFKYLEISLRKQLAVIQKECIEAKNIFRKNIKNLKIKEVGGSQFIDIFENEAKNLSDFQISIMIFLAIDKLVEAEKSDEQVQKQSENVLQNI